MVKKEFIFLLALMFLAVIGLNFVSTIHLTSSNLANVNVTQYYIYNITLNNTNVGENGNITQVNITLPSAGGFVFVANSNGTNTPFVTFTNTSTVLSWTNTTNYLINGSANNSYFWFNASASTPGRYNISITSLNGTGAYQTNVSIRVQDTTAPIITLIAPTNGNSTINPAVNTAFTFNITDTSSDSTTNCSLILNGIKINLNSSVNISGASTVFTNSSGYLVSNTWSVNCTDSDNNHGNSSTSTFSLISFQFNGTAKDENGAALNNSVINITVRGADFSALAYTSGTSNASGWFNFSIPSNSSWMYEPSIIRRNTTNNNVDFRSKTIPAFPSVMLIQLAGTNFYLTPAGTINITAINASGARIPFQYQVKDTKMGYPVAEDHTNWVTEVNVYVPSNRNYSIMIYPNQSMPVSYNWNNFSSSTSYNFNYSSSFNHTTKTLHKQFNVSMTMARVTGYLTNASGYPMNASSLAVWTNFTVIPYLLEPGNMVHSDYGDMPYNLSAANQQQSDLYNLTTGFFNISLPATAETSTILLFASLVNGTNYYGGFRNISLAYGTTLNATNITIYGLLGNAGNITMDRIDGDGQNIAIPTKKQTFNLVNATNSSLTQTQAHIETTVDYSSYGALEFTWMSDIQQSQSIANFAIPLLNVTGIKEMNVYASGGPSGGNRQYAPKRVSTTSALAITTNPNITIKTFNPGAIDASVAVSSINISLYISNSSCDIPNPASSCLLTASSTMAEGSFNPMQTVMGGGKISFRMGYGGIIVHYVNVDMLASGPPDALFDSSANTTGTTSTSFSSALKFGSQGPTIYDYVIVSIPYSETAGSGLNDSADVNISIPLLYDDNWNVIWNVTANGTSPSALAGNYSHYSTYSPAWGNLTSSKTCTNGTLTSSNQINETSPCYIDTTNNKIWIRLPHFSGTGPAVSGSTTVLAASTTSTTSSSSGTGTSTLYWTSTQSLTPAQFITGYAKLLAVKNRLSFLVKSSTHYAGVVSLTSTQATINISSTPQQAVFSIGDEKKFDVTNDNYYDVYVKLNSIANNKANITIKSIYEVVPASPPETTTPSDTTPSSSDTTTPLPESTSIFSSVWFWVLVMILLVVIIAAIVIAFVLRRGRGSFFQYPLYRK